MTVLYFADTRFPIERANGVQTMASCHALATRGHHVTLVVRPDSTSPSRDPFAFYGLPPIEALQFHVVPAGGTGHARRIRFLLSAAALATRRADAVVLTRDLGLAAWLVQLPKSRRPPVVYESHGLADVVAAEMPALLGRPDLVPSPRKLSRLARREQRVWTKAAVYIAITKILADELAGRFGPRSKVFVVPDGARPSVAGTPAAASDANTMFTAAYAGHLYPWKGVDVFVRALALAPDVHGLIVGGHPSEPDLDRVMQLVRELRLDTRVTLTGLVPPREVLGRLQTASVLVLPNTASAISERYTSPLKLFEYLTLGRPIVASDLPSIREVLTDGRTAVLVTPGDPTALAEALRRIRADAALGAALGAEAAALAPRFTWDARAQHLEAALLAARAS